jgi:hypothetical protein
MDEFSRRATPTIQPNEGDPIMKSVADRINPRETRAWHARTAPMMMWSLVFALGLVLTPHASAQEQHNIIITTDIGADPDDFYVGGRTVYNMMTYKVA